MPFVDQFCFLVHTFAPVYHKILAFTLKSSNFGVHLLCNLVLRSGALVLWSKTYIITFFPYCELLCFNTKVCTFTIAFESVTNPEYNSVFVGCALLRVHAVRLGERMQNPIRYNE